jgi:DNA-directed RNA polymerase sigma subunit (sigma70/sigma32)
MEFDYTQFTIRRVMGVLKPRDQKIVAAYFGIGHAEEFSTMEIAKQFDMTNVRVSQIVKSAIQKMKEII